MTVAYRGKTVENVLIEFMDGTELSIAEDLPFSIIQVHDDKNCVSVYCYGKLQEVKPDAIKIIPWHRIKEMQAVG